MKLHLLAVLAMMWVSFSVQAVCPVQGTTAFYLNGMSNNQETTSASADELEEKVLADSRVNPECVIVEPAFNSNELHTTEFVENGLRISEELTGSVQSFWENVLRLKAPDLWFDDEVDRLFVRVNDAILAGTLNVEEQVNASLAKFRTDHLNLGRQAILLSHSAGNVSNASEPVSATTLP